MLHMIACLLKITGILLVIVLSVILLTVCSVLLVPIRYHLEGKKEDKLQAFVKVTWLLRIFRIQAGYDETGLHYQVSIFKKVLLSDTPPEEKKKEKKKKKEQKKTKSKPNVPSSEKKKEPEIIETAEIEKEPEVTETTEAEEEPEVIETAETEEEPEAFETEEESEGSEEERFSEDEKKKPKSKTHKIEAIKEKFRKIKEQIDKYLDFIRLSTTKATFSHLKKEGRYLLLHYGPRVMEGKVYFGFEDPALTGEVLGILSVANVLLGGHLETEADFEKAVLQGSLRIKGHIRSVHILKTGISLILDNNIRRTIKEMKKLRRE
ncbi:MAG: DUF2953 domain-containing protein [Muricoprocola sp.]